MDGFEVCRRVKAAPETRLTPVVLITGLSATEDRIRGINAGADDLLSKPIDFNELLARTRSLVRLKQFTDELENAESVLFSLAHSIEARDPYTRGHRDRREAVLFRSTQHRDAPVSPGVPPVSLKRFSFPISPPQKKFWLVSGAIRDEPGGVV